MWKSQIWGRRWKQLTFSGWRPSIPLSSVSGELEHEDIDNPVSDSVDVRRRRRKKKNNRLGWGAGVHSWSDSGDTERHFFSLIILTVVQLLQD